MKKNTVLIIFISSLLVTISPLIIPVKITSNKQLDKDINFGKPIYFIDQKSNLTPLNEDFPIWLRIEGIWENPTKFIFKNYVGSIIITNLLILMGSKIIFREH